MDRHLAERHRVPRLSSAPCVLAVVKEIRSHESPDCYRGVASVCVG